MIVSAGGGEVHLFKIDPFVSAAVTQGAFAASPVNEDAAHRLSRCRKEVSAPSELWVVVANQPQPGFVDKGCGLQRVARRLIRHLGGCEPAQLLIDQRQQFIGGLGVAALDSLNYPGDIAHAVKAITSCRCLPEDLLGLRMDVLKQRGPGEHRRCSGGSALGISLFSLRENKWRS